MLLLLEIFLTVRAWKKGWGARALIPMALVFTMGFLLGAAQAAAGATSFTLPAAAVVLDLAAVVALGVMARRAPAHEHGRQAAEADRHVLPIAGERF
jgi:hypothetical protein